MKTRVGLVWLVGVLFLLIFGWHGEVRAQVVDQEEGVVPSHSTVGELGSWTVIYRLDEDMEMGGGIKVQFPVSWFVFPWPYRKPVQIGGVEQPHCVMARTSKTGAGIVLSVDNHGVDGQYHRFGRTFVGILEGQALETGQLISVTFANTQAPTISGVDEIGIALDLNGDGDFRQVSDPLLDIQPGPMTSLRVIAPSQAAIGEPFTFRVVAFDEYENIASSLPRNIDFHSTDVKADLPLPPFGKLDNGAQIFTATLHTTGIQYLSIAGGTGLSGPIKSNPIRVEASLPDRKVFWGDIHSHSAISHDGVGQPENAFAYAQKTGLDFYALTDHANADDGSEGLTDTEWRSVQNLVQDLYEPDDFVTFLGYEWSACAPYGHRNIIYRDSFGPLFRLRAYPTIQIMWQAFADAGVEALTIPHHTAIVWGDNTLLGSMTVCGGRSPYVDWSFSHHAFQNAAEIYSLHGSDEYYGSPLSYEKVDFVPGCSSNLGPYYVRDGWAGGQRLGVIGSSDNHTTQPGLPYGGLTAVYAPGLTREAVFDAIADGHTYATTGARILLEFTADHHWMGESYVTDAPPRFTVKVAGTGALDYVELIKYTGETYDMVYGASGLAEDTFTFDFVDPALAHPSLYYVRLKQADKVGGRDVMAWSSPIWITPTADLDVNVRVEPRELSPGQSLAYTITYSNTGLVTAEDVYICNMLSPYISTPPWIQTVEASETRICYGVGDLSMGQSGAWSTNFFVDEDVPWGQTTVTNTVEITTSSQEVDMNNNISTAKINLTRYHWLHLPLVMRGIPPMALSDSLSEMLEFTRGFDVGKMD